MAELKRRLAGLSGPAAADLSSVVDHLVRRSVWIVGGDGWAYDIGSGGLDHVLATGRNVNVLILDTEVYSNTGGQSSKSTPLGAVAKFATGGKSVAKKDVALQAMAYGGVYVARVAMGADPQQTLQAFREAEAYDGPSLIIAYSHCIAHGIEMNAVWTSSTARSRAGTGRWCATTRWPAWPGRIRSCSTRRARGFRWPTTATASCAIAPCPTPIRWSPNGCSNSPSRKSRGAGTSTRRWLRAAR